MIDLKKKKKEPVVMEYSSSELFVKQRSKSLGYNDEAIYISPVTSLSDSDNEPVLTARVGLNGSVANQMLIDTIDSTKKHIMQLTGFPDALNSEIWSAKPTEPEVSGDRTVPSLKKLIFEAESALGKSVKFSNSKVNFFASSPSSESGSTNDPDNVLDDSADALGAYNWSCRSPEESCAKKRHLSADCMASEVSATVGIPVDKWNLSTRHNSYMVEGVSGGVVDVAEPTAKPRGKSNKRKAGSLDSGAPDKRVGVKISGGDNRERHLERNRLAAIRSRARKKQMFQDMEANLSRMYSVNKVLTLLTTELTNELIVAKSRIKELESQY